MKRILITGGAGFIGSHLANELLQNGYKVRALDNLTDQVHGPSRRRPAYLNPSVELQIGDVRDPEAVRKALKGVDAVFHLAAMVGVGQSMYDLVRYSSVNDVGTAALLEALIEKPVERLLVASSMSIYGEGLYSDIKGKLYTAAERTEAQLREGRWELRAPSGEVLQPLPTPEWKPPALASVYALNKYSQERMCLMVARTYGISATALRFFNAYGPHQSLSNPYTGVLAIFASRLLSNNPPVIYEDGEQMRDFVSVYDVARACRLALETPEAAGQAINIASGQPVRIKKVAEEAGRVLGKENIEPEISGKYRAGDIRHCIPDTTLARQVLGFEAEYNLEDGLIDLAAWLEGQIAPSHALAAQDEPLTRLGSRA